MALPVLQSMVTVALVYWRTKTPEPLEVSWQKPSGVP